jgi:signal transduction histidine kinase
LQKIEFGKKVIIVGIDLTEKIKLQNQIDSARAIEVQNAKLVSLGELAAGVGHEINNPLMIISGNVIRIRKDVESIDVITSNQLSLKIDKIENAIGRITKILSNLKLLSRNTETDAFEKTSLNKLIESSLELIHHRTLESKIKITASIDSNLVINCLPPELLQVFYNLLNNSIDALSNLETQWIEINCDQLSDKVLIRFLDSGPGIDQQKISKLFEPFFTTKAPGLGTGLGLSICRNIIEKHNGRIYYNPNITHTCFVIELPTI